MELPSSNYKAWFAKHGQAPPAHFPHGTEEEIEQNLKPLTTNNWRMEGNMLITDTPQGRLVQRIDPGYICLGTDENGKPLLEKIKL